MEKGLKRDSCLDLVGLSTNQYYYKEKGSKPGPSATKQTKYRDPNTLDISFRSNEEVISKVVELKLDPDHANWYRMITATLQVLGYFINHKKVYRLMQSYLLLDVARKRKGRNFVKYRRVAPKQPLQILEMDIKYIWIYGMRKYAFVLSVIDTFTRYILDWTVGYSMKGTQVKQLWERLVANYLQDLGFSNRKVDVEIRNDNGRQFGSNVIMDFFNQNHLKQVFTHPYTPEENGHIESFHSILGKALKQDKFDSLEQAEKRLDKFYFTYNNQRSHGSLKGLAPSKFWKVFEGGSMEVTEPEERKLKFELMLPRQDVLLLNNINKYDYEYRFN